MNSENYVENQSNEKLNLTMNKKFGGIQTSRVVNVDYLNSLGDIYKCSICFNVMVNPTDCEKCGHSYCLECISNLKCPFHCEPIKTKPSSVGIRILLNQIIFKCTYEGCDSQLGYNNTLQHDQDCVFQPTKCPSPNCGKIIRKCNLEKHMREECDYIYKKCEYCGNEFFSCDLNEHTDHCENIYNSLTNKTSAKSKGSIGPITNGSKYLEALNFNIAKIIKEHELKYKSLEEENLKIKNEISKKGNNNNNNNNSDFADFGIENVFSTDQQKPNNNLHSEQQAYFSDNKNILELQENISAMFESLLVKFKEVIKENNEILRENFQEVIFTTKQVDDSKSLNSSHEDFNNNIAKLKNINNNLNSNTNFNNSNTNFDNSNNNYNNTNIKNSNNNLEISSTSYNVNEIVNKVENRMVEFLDQIKNYISVEIEKINTENNKNLKLKHTTIEVESKEYSKQLENIFSKLNELQNLFLSKDSNISTKMEKELQRSRTDSLSEYHNPPHQHCFDVNKLVLDFIKNVIEVVGESNEKYKNYIISDLKKINDNMVRITGDIAEEIDNLKLDISSINNKTKEIQSIIMEEFSDIQKTVASRHVRNSSSSVTEHKLVTSGNVESNSEIFQELEKNINLKLKEMELRLEEGFDRRLKTMYDLKWCNECEKVDYFFGFIKCNICKKENCKQCVLLCKGCKILYCKRCVQCPKCGELSCKNCRLVCSFCSSTKGQNYCTTCMTECVFCKKLLCDECSKQCISCTNNLCLECSKFCRICNKSSCIKCDSSKNFKICFICKETSCKECIIECNFCQYEICTNCIISCKKCKKSACKKCSIECAQCADSHCLSCSKEFAHNKCSFCKKIFCYICVKNFRKCKVCKETACKDCHAQCKKCKQHFCHNCNLNCDNCEEYTCSSCVYKCVCDQLIFCEKCLFGIEPIGPHKCVLWMNENSDFTGIKSRSILPLPRNFEAKVYLEKFESGNLLVGITDNNSFSEDTLSFVDNIWAFKVKTGQKYSSKKSLEPYYDREIGEKAFIIIAVKNDNLYFRVNFDDNPPAFVIPHKEYYLYIENDTSNSSFNNVRVRLVYIRKI